MGLTGFLVAAQPSWHEGQWYSLDRPAVCDDKHGPQRVQVSAQTTGVNPSASSGQALGHEARSLTIWRCYTNNVCREPYVSVSQAFIDCSISEAGKQH